MNLEELIFIKESLQELEATAEKFNWGPSCEMAEERQKEALRIIRRAIKEAKKDAGVVELDQLSEYEKLKDEIEEFIAAHELSNPHFLRDEEIIKYFSASKEKHVKKALKELR
jgi:phage shock protein A